MRNMLSQDNYPSPARNSKPQPRVLLAGLVTVTLAALGLMATTTQVQWRLPDFDDDEAAPAITGSITVPPQRVTPQITITQPGNNIVIEKLPVDYRIPTTGSGMPEFYQTVLASTGKPTDLGLKLHQAREGFGYDGQDIFVAEISSGSYVLHCQRRSTTILRAMCWRQLALSDNLWIQYRFPRSQLIDWRQIEQTVRASIN